MSFDLLLNAGDIKIGADADLATVVDTPKLIQDVIKMVTTDLGSSKFQPSIGSLISKRLVGQTLGASNTVSVLQGSVQEAVLLLQKLQKQQAMTQTLSPAETILQLTNISVTRDAIEPRQLNVVLQIMAADGSLVTEAMTMQLM
jgi:hypothetical protein